MGGVAVVDICRGGDLLDPIYIIDIIIATFLCEHMALYPAIFDGDAPIGSRIVKVTMVVSINLLRTHGIPKHAIFRNRMARVQSHEVGRTVAVFGHGETREASVSTHLVDRYSRCCWNAEEGIRDGTLSPLWKGDVPKEQFKPSVAVEVGDGNERRCRGKGTEMERDLVRRAEGGEFIFPDLLGVSNRIDLCLRAGHSGGRRRCECEYGKHCIETFFERSEWHRHAPFDVLGTIGNPCHERASAVRRCSMRTSASLRRVSSIPSLNLGFYVYGGLNRIEWIGRKKSQGLD